MGIVWTLVKKELRLLLRDPVALILLFVLPLLFVFVFGLFVGDSFGQKPDNRLLILLVDLDRGSGLNEGEPWSKVVQRDLAETANIRIHTISNGDEEARLREADRLIREHKQAAILIFRRNFTERLNRCSFLAGGLNPFHRDGVYLEKVDVELLRDEKQPATSAVIEQVVQVSLLRVVLPWMIGRAFERLSDPEFIQLLGDKVNLPVPEKFQLLMLGKKSIPLGELLKMASGGKRETADMYKAKVGDGVQAALAEQFSKYNLRGKTWASLTKSLEDSRDGAEVSVYENREGTGLLRRGGEHYKQLVPMFVVMFVFFLAPIVGWVFVAERRQGTLRRLRTTPLTRGHILMGKMVPCFALSVGQTVFLLAACRGLFDIHWGPAHWSSIEQIARLLPVILATSLAAMGLALLIASVARSELQVAILGGFLVLVLAVVGGCVLPRELMPESTRFFTRLTPQGWALDAYRELLGGSESYEPNLAIVLHACGVLSLVGIVSLALSAWLLRWE